MSIANVEVDYENLRLLWDILRRAENTFLDHDFTRYRDYRRFLGTEGRIFGILLSDNPNKYCLWVPTRVLKDVCHYAEKTGQEMPEWQPYGNYFYSGCPRRAGYDDILKLNKIFVRADSSERKPEFTQHESYTDLAKEIRNDYLPHADESSQLIFLIPDEIWHGARQFAKDEGIEFPMRELSYNNVIKLYEIIQKGEARNLSIPSERAFGFTSRFYDGTYGTLKKMVLDYLSHVDESDPKPLLVPDDIRDQAHCLALTEFPHEPLEDCHEPPMMLLYYKDILKLRNVGFFHLGERYEQCDSYEYSYNDIPDCLNCYAKRHDLDSVPGYTQAPWVPMLTPLENDQWDYWDNPGPYEVPDFIWKDALQFAKDVGLEIPKEYNKLGHEQSQQVLKDESLDSKKEEVKPNPPNPLTKEDRTKIQWTKRSEIFQKTLQDEKCRYEELHETIDPVLCEKSREPEQWTGDEPIFDIKSWKKLGVTAGFNPMEMSRHFLILGETGSGKTKSGVEPLLKSILEYELPDSDNTDGVLKAACLVIDPKSELKKIAEDALGLRLAEERIISLDIKDEWHLHIFEGVNVNKMTADEILNTVRPLSKSWSQDSPKLNSFLNPACNIIRDILEAVLFFDKRRLNFWLELKERITSEEWVNNNDSLSSDDKMRFSNKIMLRRYFQFDPNDYFRPILDFVTQLATDDKTLCISAFKDTCDVLEQPRLSVFLDVLTNADDPNYYSLICAITNILKDLVLEDIVRHVSLNPFVRPSNCVSIADAVDKGQILIYSPNNNSFVSDVIGRTIKKQFFVTTFERKNKKRPIAYVCDEFQRFITGDRESGEQSFLDTCRAYRAICVLATQSIASISKALRDSSENYPDDCISIILNNTGTKLFFRNTDVDTQRRLATLIPRNPYSSLNSVDNAGVHVIDARPISTLKLGECYSLLVNGDWGRGMVELEGPKKPTKQKVKTQTGKPTMPLNDSVEPVEHSTRRLMGEVTETSILKLCDEIDLDVTYFHYQRIRIEICSPGGSVLALEHFLTKLKEWRRLGVVFETLSLISTASAAAMILSLGDIGYRRAYSSASLVYHNTRHTIKEYVFTKAAHEQLAKSLQKADDKLLNELLHYIYDNGDSRARGNINLLALRDALKEHGSDISLPALDDKSIARAKYKVTRDKYEKVLRELFFNDRPINPEEAVLLGLIDEVL